MKTQLACGVVLALIIVGCSSDSEDATGVAGANGVTAGRTAAGGKAGTGGTKAPAAGQASLGGASVAGATASAGAPFANGGTSSSAAGNASTAGTTSTVGVGGAANGGTLSAGGKAAAGAPAIGGSVAVAGSTAAGGTLPAAGGAAVAAGGVVAATGGIAATAGSNAGSVAVAGATATGGACATTYYRDADHDTWGSAVTSCTGGTGWVTRTGDCNDANADVHPDQTETFAVAYATASGASSFDYNCDGTETTAGGTQSSTGQCVASGLGNSCTGDGYLPVDPVRTGTNLNQLCGSMRYLVCARSQQTCIGAISTDGTYAAVKCR